MIHRKYEPDRLSPNRLADAYEKVVPKHIRVIGELMAATQAPMARWNSDLRELVYGISLEADDVPLEG